jgi:hypothetical protein
VVQAVNSKITYRTSGMHSFSNRTFTGAYQPQNCTSAEESATEQFHTVAAVCTLDHRKGTALVLETDETSTASLTFRPVRDQAPSLGALDMICASWLRLLYTSVGQCGGGGGELGNKTSNVRIT